LMASITLLYLSIRIPNILSIRFHLSSFLNTC
jgi:hypothetical protein